MLQKGAKPSPGQVNGVCHMQDMKRLLRFTPHQQSQKHLAHLETLDGATALRERPQNVTFN